MNGLIKNNKTFMERQTLRKVYNWAYDSMEQRVTNDQSKENFDLNILLGAFAGAFLVWLLYRIKREEIRNTYF